MVTGDSRAEITQRLRDIARDLLERGEVDVFIGYEEGSLPLRTTPAFITRPDDVSRLTWGALCENNLATYLPKFEGRVGVVVKGCDVRALVNLIVEKQIARDQVKIVGVPCQGVIDRRKLAGAVGEGPPVRSVEETDGFIIVRGSGFEKTIPGAGDAVASLRDVRPSCAGALRPPRGRRGTVPGRVPAGGRVRGGREVRRPERGGQVRLLRPGDRALYRVLRLQAGLPALLLPGVLRGPAKPQMGRQVARSVG